MQRPPRSIARALGAPLALVATLALPFAAGCRSDVQDDAGGGEGGPGKGEVSAPRMERGIPVLGYGVVARYPHDRGAYTQGLLVVDGVLYESTGQRGESTLREVDLETGEVARSRPLPSRYFGEGLAATGGLLVQLTWQSNKALVYERETLRKLDYTYGYEGEGWGLTTRDDGMLVMSDGTSTLRIMDPKGFDVLETLEVTAAGRPVPDLNELEWVKGEIWANVYKSDRIARIDPTSGEVIAWVDLSGILGSERVSDPVDEVLNGIAHDADADRLFVTGKRWPRLFEIEVDPLP